VQSLPRWVFLLLFLDEKVIQEKRVVYTAFQVGAIRLLICFLFFIAFFFVRVSFDGSRSLVFVLLSSLSFRVRSLVQAA